MSKNSPINMALHVRAQVILILLIFSMQLLAASDLETQLGQDLPGVPIEIQQVHDHLMEQRKAGENEAALLTAARILDLVKQYAGKTNSMLLVRPYTDLATLQLERADLDNAKINFDRSIDIVEDHKGDYAPRLILPLYGLGIALTEGKDYSQATLALRRAQHISHRNFGVYTLNQIEMVDQLSLVNLLRGDRLSADQEKKFTLKISEVEYGIDDPRLVPAIEKLARYFVSQGNAPAAVNLYRRVVDIIEKHYSEDDLRLTDPLLSLGKISMQQAEYRTRGERALERRQTIISESIEADVGDRVQALVDLADAYIISSNRKASKVYQNAWELIKDKPEFVELQEEIFGTPIRLYPTPTIYLVERFPSATSEELFVDVEFTVRANGHVGDINILDANVPNDSVRQLRGAMYKYRYRPRLVDGQPVLSVKLTLHQPYQLAEAPPAEFQLKIR